METSPNKYIAVAYKLHTIDEDGKEDFIEEANAEHPFQLISGLGTIPQYFEDSVVPLKKGDKFEFTIPCKEAYGDYLDDHVVELPKSMFEVDGRIDPRVLQEDNIVPLMDSEGHRLEGIVLEVKEDVIIMDMNHRLAGFDLHFTGEVVENRDATNQEIQGMINMLTSDGCGCGCDSCDSDCGEHEHHHHDGCGCGGCH